MTITICVTLLTYAVLVRLLQSAQGLCPPSSSFAHSWTYSRLDVIAMTHAAIVLMGTSHAHALRLLFVKADSPPSAG